MVLVAIDAINASRMITANRLTDWSIGSVSAAFDLNEHYGTGYLVTRYRQVESSS